MFTDSMYRQMFENTGAMKLVVNPVDGRIVDANRAACNFYGYTPEQFKLLRVMDLNPRPESEILAALQRVTVEKNARYQGEHRLASGEIRDVEVYVGLLEVESEQYLYAILHDVSNRVKAERALRESEQVYRIFAQNMPHSSVVMFDTNMRYTLAEGPFLNQFGSTAVNMIGKTAQETLPHELYLSILPVYERILHGEIFEYEREAEDYAYHAYATPLRDDAGQIIGGMILSHDTTASKKSEAALRASESRFHSLVDLAPVGIIEVNPQGKRILCNKYICEMTGLTQEELLAADGFLMIHPDDRDEFPSLLPQILQSGHPASIKEFRILRPDNTIVWASSKSELIKDAHGKITGVLVALTDITERKEAEQLIEERQQLYHLFARNMPGSAVVMFDCDMRYTLVEGPLLQRLKIDSESVIGKTPQEVLSNESQNFILPVYQRVLRGETFTYDRAIGDYVTHSRATPLMDSAGNIIGGIVLSHDITEAKQAEAALRLSELRYRSLVELAPVGIIQTDLDGNRIFCNARWCEITGISMEDAIKNDDNQVLYPGDYEIANAAWKGMMESGLPFDNIKFRYQRSDGTAIWVSGNGTPIFDARGDVAGFLGTVTDITQLIQVQEALRIGEARYRTLVNFAPVGIVETDAHGRVVFANSRWHALSGIPENYVFVDNASGTIHPDDMKRILTIHETSVEKGESVDNLEYRFVHPDGNVVWVSDSSRPLLDTAGNVTGHIITMTDISERKRLEFALRQNEERLRLVTDNVQDLITQSDADDLLVFVSPSSRAMLSIEPENITGKLRESFFNPDDWTRMQAARQLALEQGERQFRVEGRLRHGDGHYVHIETIGKFLYDDQGKYAGGVYITRDVSERNRYQESLIEREKLQTALEKEQELSTIKTRMMMRIAHEFRTPLSIIQSSNETFVHYLDRLTPEQRVAKTTAINRSIRRIGDMLDEIGLVVTGSFTPNQIYRSPTDVSALCRKVAAELTAQLDLPNKYVLELPEKAHITTDASVLKKALLHIMRNAARYSEPSAPVTVRLNTGENGVEIQVADHGIGIPPADQVRLFEPFFRASNIGEISGLGIGLTNSRAAIVALGGSITFESVLGQGTTFTVWLPR